MKWLSTVNIMSFARLWKIGFKKLDFDRRISFNKHPNSHTFNGVKTSAFKRLQVWFQFPGVKIVVKSNKKIINKWSITFISRIYQTILNTMTISEANGPN
jgi:hypothetical protein